jgi:Carbohydrate-selective porin, OprB family
LVNLNLVKQLILTSAIFAGIGAIATEGKATDVLPTQEPVTKILPLNSQLTDRFGRADASVVFSSVLFSSRRAANQRLRQPEAPPTQTITDSRIGAPLRSSDEGISGAPSGDSQLPEWALSALQQLDDRYNCIEDNTDLVGKASPVENSSLTREKFANKLNICLSLANESIGSSPTDSATKADLETIQKLQTEFATELAASSGRVEAIEAKTERLKQQQFSATTKLNAQLWINFTGAFPSNRITAERSLAQGGTNPFS